MSTTANKRDALIQLRNLLTGVFDDRDDLKRLLFDSGIETANIKLEGAVANVWHRIVIDAVKRKQLGAIVSAAGTANHFPERKLEFDEAYARYEDARGHVRFQIWFQLQAPDVLITNGLIAMLVLLLITILVVWIPNDGRPTRTEKDEAKSLLKRFGDLAEIDEPDWVLPSGNSIPAITFIITELPQKDTDWTDISEAMKKIQCHRIHLRSTDQVDLQKLLKLKDQLRELRLGKTNGTRRSVKNLQYLKYFRHVEVLGLSGISNTEIAKVVVPMRELRTMILRGSSISNLSELKACANLVHIEAKELDNCEATVDWTNGDLTKLKYLELSETKRIRELQLPHLPELCVLRIEKVDKLSKFDLQNVRNLETLKINNTQRKGILEIIDFPKLGEIEVNENNMLTELKIVKVPKLFSLHVMLNTNLGDIYIEEAGDLRHDPDSTEDWPQCVLTRRPISRELSIDVPHETRTRLEMRKTGFTKVTYDEFVQRMRNSLESEVKFDEAEGNVIIKLKGS